MLELGFNLGGSIYSPVSPVGNYFSKAIDYVEQRGIKDCIFS